jgi:hypothetical protein
MMVSTDVTCVTSANWVTYVSTTATAAIATAPGYVAASASAATGYAASAAAATGYAASASASATANQGYEIATIS